MNIHRHRLATWILCALWLSIGGLSLTAAAAESGAVMNVTGTLTAKGPDGTLRVLAVKSPVSPGDTLITGRDSYARVKFPDGGEISLRPDSHFKILSFHFSEQQPEKDSAGFNLLKGSMRALSGLVGKRGDPDSYQIKTLAATAGIRGTAFGLLLCQNDCAHIPSPTEAPPADGLHSDVEQGTIILKNDAGSQLVNAGEFGYVQNAQSSPALVPKEQGIKIDIPAHVNAGWTKANQEKSRDTQSPAAKALECLAR
jgi:hypothetical protein